MGAYLGFVPIAVVIIPLAVAAIRQALFYKGCMDGFGYVLTAMLAFVVGGVLNVTYLLFVAVTRRRYFDRANHRQRTAARAAFIGAVLLLISQLTVVLSVAYRQLSMD